MVFERGTVPEDGEGVEDLGDAVVCGGERVRDRGGVKIFFGGIVMIGGGGDGNGKWKVEKGKKRGEVPANMVILSTSLNSP